MQVACTPNAHIRNKTFLTTQCSADRTNKQTPLAAACLLAHHPCMSTVGEESSDSEQGDCKETILGLENATGGPARMFCAVAPMGKSMHVLQHVCNTTHPESLSQQQHSAGLNELKLQRRSSMAA